MNQAESVYESVDHLEEIVSVVETETRDIDKNDGENHIVEKTNLSSAQRVEAVSNEGQEEIQAVTMPSASLEKEKEVPVHSQGDAPSEVVQQHVMTTYACNPYYMYGGYMPMHPPNTAARHPPPAEYAVYPPPQMTPVTPPESGKIPYNSKSETWIPSGAYSGHLFHTHPRAWTKTPNARRAVGRYPYNPGFRNINPEQQVKTSTNPLIAAYQQQNVDIPKSHIQVMCVATNSVATVFYCIFILF